MLLEIAGLQGSQMGWIGTMGGEQRQPHPAGLGTLREQIDKILQQRAARLRGAAGLVLRNVCLHGRACLPKRCNKIRQAGPDKPRERLAKPGYFALHQWGCQGEN